MVGLSSRFSSVICKRTQFCTVRHEKLNNWIQRNWISSTLSRVPRRTSGNSHLDVLVKGTHEHQHSTLSSSHSATHRDTLGPSWFSQFTEGTIGPSAVVHLPHFIRQATIRMSGDGLPRHPSSSAALQILSQAHTP